MRGVGVGVWEVVGGARAGVARARAAHPSSNSFVLVLGTQTRRLTSSYGGARRWQTDTTQRGDADAHLRVGSRGRGGRASRLELTNGAAARVCLSKKKKHSIYISI